MLKKSWFPLLAAAVFGVVALLPACKKSTDTTTAADATDQALYAVQDRGGLGKYGCYELVFPVSLTLPDGSTITATSYDDLRTQLEKFFGTPNGMHHHGHILGNNGHDPNHPRPEFVFPITILNQAGEAIVVGSGSQLDSLRALCAGSFDHHGWQGHGHHGLTCFEIVFPVTVQFPDSTTAPAADQTTFHDLVKAWFQSHPNTPGHPTFVFPITVRMKADSTLVTVNSKDEFHKLKEDCH